MFASKNIPVQNIPSVVFHTERVLAALIFLTEDTGEMTYAHKRQRYLIDQGLLFACIPCHL
jgi:hypothetical protein